MGYDRADVGRDIPTDKIQYFALNQRQSEKYCLLAYRLLFMKQIHSFVRSLALQKILETFTDAKHTQKSEFYLIQIRRSHKYCCKSRLLAFAYMRNGIKKMVAWQIR